ncbi:MAG: DUF5309 domain-containing protein [Zymomonas mobilis]|uniref:DUF5309 domain-containing protein n=1 Tax=Zymomonas mobilis TaxID=542 RepID=UPI0003C7446C|nr:hypothetical protein ZCP4_0886 [Zymomonas mobilis subsp. mobilis str. CP4 = NRRL B-14023]
MKSLCGNNLETPFVTAIGQTTAKNTYTEWQTDNLASANAQNKQVEGADLANESRQPTVRVGNYTQIMTKVVGTSTTDRAVHNAGRGDEHAYQLARAGQELKRDIEARFTGNFAAIPGDGAVVARETAGALAWLRSNAHRGDGGANPVMSGGDNGSGYPTTAATAGKARLYTEALLKEVLGDIWVSGGQPNMVITSLKLKQTAAAFPGLASNRRDTGDQKARIIAGADIYVSDVGEVQFVPDRFCDNSSALVIDPEYWSVATLDPIQKRSLATTGLADRDALYTEIALRCHNEAASGVLADLSAA